MCEKYSPKQTSLEDSQIRPLPPSFYDITQTGPAITDDELKEGDAEYEKHIQGVDSSTLLEELDPANIIQPEDTTE